MLKSLENKKVAGINEKPSVEQSLPVACRGEKRTDFG